MNRSRRSNRRYARPRSFLGRADGSGSVTSQLARRAGASPRASVEQLESRQLLFSLTITPDLINPNTGLGTIQAFFGYTIPVLLATAQAQNQAPDVNLEDFADEVPLGNIAGAGGNVANGRFLNQSNWYITHNITPGSNIRLVAQFNAQGQPQTDTALMLVRMASGQRVTLQAAAVPNSTLAFLAMRSLRVDIGAAPGTAIGLDLQNTRVELRFQGELVGSFTGAALGQLNTTFPGNGIGTFLFASTDPNTPVFDQIDFITTGGAGNAFTMDNLTRVTSAGNFTEVLNSRIYGAEFAFTGPVNSSIRVLDSYGREMRLTAALGAPAGGSNFVIVDPDDNGVPNFNDGIGRIVMTGTNGRSSLTVWGGAIQSGNYTRTSTFAGIYDDMESRGGFGFAFGPNGVVGLPPGPGSVVIGNPFLRNNTNTNTYNPTGPFTGAFNYLNGNHGIFVTDGSDFGSLYVHGIVMGTSRFNGYLDRYYAGYQLGSLNVRGDLGSFISGSDAGAWEIDPGQPIPGQNALPVHTQAQLVVGRTLGQVYVAGRMLMSVTVSGDVSNPSFNHPRDIFRYFELERPYELFPQSTPAAWLGRLFASNASWGTNVANANGDPFRLGGQTPINGGTLMRNNNILTAEWVGNVGTAVQIYGNLGGGDDQVLTDNDVADVYGFASDGRQEIIVEVQATTPLGLHVRLMDHNGRTVAAVAADTRVLQQNLPNAGLRGTTQVMRYKPTAPGTYYLVLANGAAGDQAINADYVATIGGMASTTLGSIRTGGQFGDDPVTNPIAISVLGGSVGAIRVGTGITSASGAQIDPLPAYNDDVTDTDTRMEWKTATVSIAGSLYGIVAGGDIQGPGLSAALVIVGGDLGELVTGLSPVIGVGPREGDVGGLDLRVGGRIGFIDIKGAVGIDQDNQQAPDTTPLAPTLIRTGTNGGDGSIGMFRVGEHVVAGLLNITTSPGSTVGAFLISQDAQDETGQFTGIYSLGFGVGTGLGLTTGFGSDVRFVDFPRIDQPASVNAQIPIVGGQFLDLVDDGGGRVRIQITGVAGGVVAGFVRVLPISGSQGVAISQIDADLSNGRALVVTGLGQAGNTDVISIGRINITNATAGSAVRFLGPSEIDVWQISQSGGTEFGTIVNETPRGDIVSIDVQSLTRLTILSGDLGRTRVPEFGPQQIGPFIGVARGGGQERGGPVGIGGFMPGDWNGNMFRPTTDVNLAPTNAYLDDIGSPMDPYLNGMIVRTGSVTDVQVGGAVGDVFVQGGNLTNLIANFDAIAAPGRFDGIIGTVFASGDVVRVNVGSGLAARTQSPLSTTGIFAGDDVIDVLALGGASIFSTITAANSATTPAPEEGVVRITINGGGSISDAYISSEFLDGFWFSFYGFPSDGRTGLGNIFSITGVNANMFRTGMFAANLVTLSLTNGFWDASVLATTGDIGTLTAAGFRNSTLQGTDQEFAPNAIVGGRNIARLSAGSAGGVGGATLGDISDLRIDLLGSITQSITARNISRAVIDVDQSITLMSLSGDLRASEITAGQLVTFTALHNVRTSRFLIAGPITAFTAGDEIFNTEISSTGPDGRIDLVTARTRLSGTVAASGPIGTINVTAGDMDALIRTTTARGNVTLLTAARDLNIRTDISGNLSQLTAGRHIGQINTPRTILVRGNLANVDVGSGQLYSDIRIGQGLTGTALIGAPTNKPGFSNLGLGSIVSFGPINVVRTLGDFGGQIISYTGGITLVSINDGSLLPGALVAAYDGDLRNLVINRGHLLGDVHADYILWAINVNASDDGVFGDIGVNPALNPNVSYDSKRNQLPPGVIANTPIQGPHITAGKNIGRITTSNGSMFETFVYAERAIGTITINGSVRNDDLTGGLGTQIIAGSSMFRVLVSGDLRNTAVVAGVKDLGADGRLGGTGVNRDSNQSGRIGTVNVSGNASDSIVSAGLTAGADGVYNTADDAVVLGLSFVRNVLVGGSVSNVSVYSDWAVENAAPGLTLGGTNAPPADPRIFGGGVPAGAVLLDRNGGTATFTTLAGEVFTARFTADNAAARAYWHAATNRIILINTHDAATLNVTATPPLGAARQLTDFHVVSNDDASIGSIVIDANLLGDSYVVIDNNVVNMQFNNAAGNVAVVAGGNFRNFTTGNFAGGSIEARFIRTATFAGSFGVPTLFDEARLSVLAASTVNIMGNHAGAVNIDRDIDNFIVGGAMNLATFRSGSNVGSFRVGSLSQSRVSVRDSLGPVVVTGNVFETAIMAGGDLGADGVPGGVGPFDADRTTSGFITSVTVGGSFTKSSIVAGITRGPDGFFGTDDDSVAAGRSTIGPVTITGTAFGSNFLTEQYRISATGALSTVTIAGAPPATSGNFRVLGVNTTPLAIQVESLNTRSVSRVFEARITFNQAMDSSTIGAALRISEVRDSGNTLIPLTSGVHYTVAYDAATRTAVVTFARAVTDRNLPQQPGVPGPGVYRFELSADILRAQVVDARLDGNNNGQVAGADDYSEDAVVGDAGDKITPGTVTGLLGQPVDFYGPVDLDLILDNNRNPDRIPDPNRVFTIQGSIGDHADNDPSNFPFAGDADVYKVTLRAGQILHLGPQKGTALFATRTLLTSNGVPQFGESDDVLVLPSDIADFTSLNFAADYLIKRTGTYYIVVDNSFGAFPFAQGLVPNLGPTGATIGDYAFDLEIFDDGNTGFSADTDSGNGEPLVTAPASIAFAGPDLQFGTADDLARVVIGSFVFTLDRGPDGVPNTIDDIVTGSNGKGITVTRTDGDRVTTRIESAIGPEGHVGVPGDLIRPDVDVYHLNNGQPLAPNTRFTVTLKLSERGSDLGSRVQRFLTDFNGAVQFGIFETTTASAVDDGLVVFSPSAFRSSGGTPGTTLASNGPVSYGYDANGDFTMTFVTPGRLGASTPTPASYALYIQGVFNTDYVVEVVQQGTAPVTRVRQNIFIETRGGTLDWLLAGGLSTDVDAFRAAALGFTGTVNGLSIDQYILNSLVSNLTALYNAAGVDVRVSLTSASFEFQPYSTIFLTSSNDPINSFNLRNYGDTQASDPYNTNKNDQAAVFIPSFATLGLTPSTADLGRFIQSLTAAVGRRAGELMGLRATEFAAGGVPRDIMAANSPQNQPTGNNSYRYLSTSRQLAGLYDGLSDTRFFLGRQNSQALLDRFLAPLP
jgi:hypothetical protein